MGSTFGQVDLFLSGHIEQAFGNILAGNTPELITLTARQDGHGNPFRLRRRQDEDDMGRRFFQGLQKGIESFCRQHMDFIDDVNLLMAFSRHEFNRFPQGADVFDAAVGSGIDFDDIQGLAAHDVAADFTFIARVGRRPVDTVHGPGKNFSRTRLARPAGTRKQVSMGYFVRIYRFLQGFRDMGLADDIFKILRPPFAV